MHIYRPVTTRCFRFTLFVAVIAILGGCSIRKPLVLLDKNQPIKPASIAVIAGNNEPVDIAMAEALTKEL